MSMQTPIRDRARGLRGPGLLPADMATLDAKVAEAAGSATSSATSADDAQASAEDAAGSLALSNAAAAGIVTQFGAVTELTPVEAAGVNLSVNYAGAADGTAGDAVGTPPLVASGKAFSVVGGYAVSAADATATAPAFLRHTPNYAAAVQTTVIAPASGQNAATAQNIGPLIYYTDALNFAFWGVNKDTGQVYVRRVSNGALTSLLTFTTGAGAMASWTLETSYVGKRTFNVVLIRPDGTRYPVTYNASADFIAAWGIVSVGPSLRARSVVVNTNRSVVVRRVSDNETAIAKATANFQPRILNEPDAEWSAPSADGGFFDIKGMPTEQVLIDNFTGADGAFPGSRVPDYAAPNLPSGYIQYGTMNWETIGNKLAPVGPYGDANRAPGLLVAALSWPLSETWLDTAKGVEISFDLSTTANGYGSCGAFFKTASGGFLVQMSEAGCRLLYRSETGSGSATLASGYPAIQAPGSVRCIVRVYEGNGFIAQIGGVTMAWGFVGSTGGLGKTYPKIIGAGVYMDPGSSQAATRFDNLKIGPVPAQGGSRYRSLPALPPPISPVFTKRGIQWGITQADTGYGVYNFSVVNMAAIAGRLGVVPIDNYYAYFSTDHAIGAQAAGGIFYATAPSPLGPWTRRGAAGYDGKIYSDPSGNQTETPVVNYDPVGNRLLMIYQQVKTAGVNRQESRVASSVDGVNWTKIGPIYAWSETPLVSDHARHTGYMSWGKDPLGVVPGWIGWSRLYPGTTSSLCCTTRSVDGVHWDIDLLPTYFPFLQSYYDDTRVIHNHGYNTAPFAYQGQRLMIVAPFRPTGEDEGGGTSRGYLALVRLGDDMRNMSAQEVIPFPLTETDELTGSNTISGTLVENGTLYVWYQSRNRDIRLATADLTKGPDGLARVF